VALSLADLEGRHATAEQSRNAVAARNARQEARRIAARDCVDVPTWARPRKSSTVSNAPGRTEPPRRVSTHAPSEPAPRIEIPNYARRWRERAPGSGACVRVTEGGVQLSYFDEASGERLSAYLPHSRFTTENAAAYALAQGSIRFDPLRRKPAAKGATPWRGDRL
jgi:hypothetical protein